MTFDVANFLAPLDVWVVVMPFAIGLGMGLAMRHAGRHIRAGHLFWWAAGGVVFFVPLALLRAFQGSTQWERLLATTPLWLVYVVGMYLASRWRDDD